MFSLEHIQSWLLSGQLLYSLWGSLPLATREPLAMNESSPPLLCHCQWSATAVVATTIVQSRQATLILGLIFPLLDVVQLLQSSASRFSHVARTTAEASVGSVCGSKGVRMPAKLSMPEGKRTRDSGTLRHLLRFLVGGTWQEIFCHKLSGSLV
uniref:Uncharacterized protein n=1 Tax=Sphaerodactylus townsendi TaxID=933632 RepID=A0ACB8F7D9_9SAUR